MVERFHCYVANGLQFTIITDHAAIAILLRSREPSGGLARWILRLSPYNFVVVYRPGRLNAVADALSRNPIAYYLSLNMVALPTLLGSDLDLAQLQARDSFCAPIIAALRAENPDAKQRHKSLFYFLKNSVLYRKVFRDGKQVTLLVVPKVLINNVLTEAHESPLGGHQGVARTHARIQDKYYFPGQIERVARHVATCESCQHKNDPIRKPGGYLQSLQVKGPFVRLHFDFCGPFPTTQRRGQYILLATCPMTKFVIAKAVPAATAAAAANFLVNQVVIVHGCFEELLTDRGTHFTGDVMKQVVKLLGVKHLLTSSYHPQTDGNAERAIKTAVNILSHYTSDNQKDWDLLLPFVVWVMNTSKSETTGYSPFQLVYGRLPIQPLDIAMLYDGLQQIADPSDYLKQVVGWLEKAREIAIEKVNKTHDKEAPRYNDKLCRV